MKNCMSFIVILICFYGIGCRTYSIDNFHLAEPFEPHIPSLKVEFDDNSFEKVYSTARGASYSVVGVSYKPDSVDIESNLSIYEKYSDLMGEAAIICNRELSKFFGEPNSKENHGFALFRIKKRDHSVNFAWYYTSFLTLGTLNLLGYPVSSHTATFEVELEILDSQRNSITKYSAEGRATKYAAMYWGYSGSSHGFLRPNEISGDVPVAQAANAAGLIKAIENLKQKVQQDADKIRTKLLQK